MEEDGEENDGDGGNGRNATNDTGTWVDPLSLACSNSVCSRLRAASEAAGRGWRLHASHRENLSTLSARWHRSPMM
eukprot:3104790-Rhodomonas_salina.2